ncbi:MAG: hypothetical protein SGBAC_002539 [Bacillariaceae sp.]
MYDLIVIGGGVVGCAILRAATLQGYKCCLVEAQADLLSQASGSNSGIACTGVDATPGSLERALIRDANSQFRIYCEEHNIPTRPCGSLVCLWPWDKVHEEASGSTNKNEEEDDHHPVLKTVLAESHDGGDTHASLLTQEQVLGMEPNLSSFVQGGCHIPGEIVVDPWLYSISLAVHARENGARIINNFYVDPLQSSFRNGVWTIVNGNFQMYNSQYSNPAPKLVQGKVVVNAAGIFADILQRQFGAKANNANEKSGEFRGSWTAKPRRGQYRVYNTAPFLRTRIMHPIQPVPSQFTKGIFVFSTMYHQLVVGPTALDQDSRTDRRIDPKVAKHLDGIANRIVPELDPESACVGEYVGIRPGTDQRDYQIHLDPANQWIAVAGIRSTGLTASLGIGNYVLRQLQCVLPSPKDVEPKLTPLPSVVELQREFQASSDGRVIIQGHSYKVTHPLTKLGWSECNTSGFETSSSKL